ncbi:hypothetical protein V6590_15965 [Gemmobacter sp. JM10B15]|uniref:Uncharacterized protein n=1 Tax=Gemmobacter denitrificans TaxID=3123040 RepID=A0ABU8BY63_9RHOB
MAKELFGAGCVQGRGLFVFEDFADNDAEDAIGFPTVTPMAIDPKGLSGCSPSISTSVGRLDLAFGFQSFAEPFECDVLEWQVSFRTLFPQLGNKILVEFDKLVQTGLRSARHRKGGGSPATHHSSLRAEVKPTQCCFPVAMCPEVCAERGPDQAQSNTTEGRA